MPEGIAETRAAVARDTTARNTVNGAAMPESWTLESWRGLPIRQVPGYTDAAALGRGDALVDDVVV